MCGNFDADPSLLEQISRFGNDLKDGSGDRHASVLAAQMDMVIQGIENNLASRKFMYMPAEDAAYWNNLKVFGDYFTLDFPKAAIFEALEAANCFAVGRGTACVFHCMRVAEYGLRKLAKTLHVTITHSGKNCPVEYADWDKVITAIKAKIAIIRQRPRGKKRESALQYYSNAADHCEYMKDIWRNEMAHARRLYNKAETLAVLNRVRDFALLFEPSGDNAQKLRKRIRQIRRLPQTSVESAAQRDQGTAGSGKTGEKAEEN